MGRGEPRSRDLPGGREALQPERLGDQGLHERLEVPAARALCHLGRHDEVAVAVGEAPVRFPLRAEPDDCLDDLPPAPRVVGRGSVQTARQRLVAAVLAQPRTVGEQQPRRETGRVRQLGQPCRDRVVEPEHALLGEAGDDRRRGHLRGGREDEPILGLNRIAAVDAAGARRPQDRSPAPDGDLRARRPPARERLGDRLAQADRVARRQPVVMDAQRRGRGRRGDAPGARRTAQEPAAAHLRVLSRPAQRPRSYARAGRRVSARRRLGGEMRGAPMF
jgi:hypothetical protein